MDEASPCIGLAAVGARVGHGLAGSLAGSLTSSRVDLSYTKLNHVKLD